MKSPNPPRPRPYTEPHPDIAGELRRLTRGTGLEPDEWFARERQSFERRRNEINRRRPGVLRSNSADEREAFRLEVEEFERDFPSEEFAVYLIPDHEWKLYLERRFEESDFLTADEVILRLAAKHGLEPPLGAEDFALLVVRLATAHGEPGFDQLPSTAPGRPSKAGLHASLFAIMEREITAGAEKNAAAETARNEAIGHDFPGEDVPSVRRLVRIFNEKDAELRGETALHEHLFETMSRAISGGMDVFSAANHAHSDASKSKRHIKRQLEECTEATREHQLKKQLHFFSNLPTAHQLASMFTNTGAPPSPTLHRMEHLRISAEAPPTTLERAALALIDHKKLQRFPNPNAIAGFGEKAVVGHAVLLEPSKRA